MQGSINYDLKQTGGRLHNPSVLGASKLYRHVNSILGFLNVNAKNSSKESKAYVATQDEVGNKDNSNKV